jgi:PAS domain S-box-containing protein
MEYNGMSTESDACLSEEIKAFPNDESKLPLLLSHSPDIIMEIDRDGTLLYINRTFPPYTPEQVIGTSCYDYIEQKNRDAYVETVQGVFETGEPARIETTGAGPEGTISIYETRFAAVAACGRVDTVLLIARDITESKIAEKALADSRERLEMLFEYAPDAYYITDLMGNLIDGNRAAEEMAGYRREELIGKNMFEVGLLVPEEVPKVMELANKSRQGEPTGPDEVVLVRKDGNRVKVEICTYPTDIRGQGHVLSIARDVTERQRAREELRQALERNEATLRAIPDVVFRLSRQGEFLYYHANSENGLYRPVEEFLGTKLSDLLPKEFAEMVQRHIDEALDSGEVQTFEYQHPTATGLRQLEARFAPSGEDEVVVLVRDITDLKRAEEELAASEGRFRTIFEEANDGINIVDSKTRRHIMSNETFHRMVGYSREEMENVGVEDLHPEADLPSVLELFEKQGRGELTVATNVPVKRKDGKVFFADISACRMMLGGNLCQAGIFRDVTDRKDAESRLEEQARRLSEKNRELESAREELAALNEHLEERVRGRTEEVEKLLRQKDELMHRMGHDLKSPLTPIISLLPIVREQETAPEKAEMMDLAIERANYMQQLVNQVLKLARRGATAPPLELVDTDLREVVGSIVRGQEPAAQQKNIRIAGHAEHGSIVKAERLGLYELLDNLIGNAIKYTPEGGSVTVGVRSNGDLATVSVSDTGIGMTEEQLSHIFDEFYRVDQSKDELESSGLGLAICKRIVEQHGGTIWADSQGLGQGTTVSFTINLVEEGVKFSEETPVEAA